MLTVGFALYSAIDGNDVCLSEIMSDEQRLCVYWMQVGGPVASCLLMCILAFFPAISNDFIMIGRLGREMRKEDGA